MTSQSALKTREFGMSGTKDLQTQSKLKLKRRASQFNPGRTPISMIVRLVAYGLISLSITAALSAVAVLVFPLTGELKDMPATVQWSLLEGFASLITLALVIGGAVFVFLEHIHNQVQEKRENAIACFDVYKVLFDTLMNSEDTASRRWILQNMPVLKPFPCKEENESEVAYAIRIDQWALPYKKKIFYIPIHSENGIAPGQFHIKRVLNTFDFIGFVAKNYWSMENELVEWMSPPIAKVWERLGPYIEYEATRRNEKDYYIFARDFSDYCLLWWKDHYPDPKIVEDAL
jgi:hypothetical protein